jgi:phospholipid transport system substrate-binding protein
MARCVLAAVGILVVSVSAAPATAGEPTERLRTFFERANGVIVAPGSEDGFEQRLHAVRALVNEVFDFEGAAVLALGRHWQGLPVATRPTVTRLYADIIERGYLAWVGSKARLGEGGVSVRWVDERVEGDTATVTSALLTRAGDEVPIDYVLVRRGEDWRVRDVVVDGMSLAANYHVQIERVVQAGSYEALIERMRDRASPTAREEATASVVPAAAPDSTAVVPADAPPAVTAQPPAAASLGAPPVVPPPVAVPAPPLAVAPTVSSRAVTPSDTPVAPPARAVVAETRGDVWVQVGAFRTVDAAAKLVQRLRRAVTIATGSDRLARVLVGPFADRAAAASTVRALHASGIAAFIAE